MLALSKSVYTEYKYNNEKKLHVRGSLDKFPDFFPMSTSIDSTHIELYSPSK